MIRYQLDRRWMHPRRGVKTVAKENLITVNLGYTGLGYNGLLL
jgi:hypothetical protein